MDKKFSALETIKGWLCSYYTIFIAVFFTSTVSLGVGVGVCLIFKQTPQSLLYSFLLYSAADLRIFKLFVSGMSAEYLT